MSGKLKRNIGLVLILVTWLIVIMHIKNSSGMQWDFETYYYAAEVHATGGNPYDLRDVNLISPEEIDLPYVYPPLTIYFFRLFTPMDWNTAQQVWLWLKVVMGIALVILWRRYFYSGGSLGLFLLFALLAFSSAPYWDLITGNVTMVEQLLLWLAFLFFLQQRSLLFALFVVLASIFKFPYLAFLILVFALPRKDWLKSLLVGGGGGIAYAAANVFLFPNLFKHFVTQIGTIDEGGEKYNHSLLAFINDSERLLEAWAQSQFIPDFLVNGLYIVVAVAIIVVSARFWMTYARAGRDSDLLLVFFACVVFAVVAPRMKAYAYILLILPAFYVIRECVKAQALLFLFILMSLTKWTPLPMVGPIRLLWWHYPWLLAVMTWALMLQYLRQESHDTEIVAEPG